MRGFFIGAEVFANIWGHPPLCSGVRFTLSPGVLEAARGGGPGLDSLLREVWPLAYRVALGIVRDPGLAEDCAQDACASIARGLSTLRSGDAFYVWIHRIIVRHATHAAAQRPRIQALPAEIVRESPVANDERIDLLDALASLPAPQRAAVVLRY